MEAVVILDEKVLAMAVARVVPEEEGDEGEGDVDDAEGDSEQVDQ